jgi:hypothetical protein
LKLGDLETIDVISFRMLKDIMNVGDNFDAEAFECTVSETFVTYLSTGQEIELYPGGKDVKVTHSNYKEFIKRVTKIKLTESK